MATKNKKPVTSHTAELAKLAAQVPALIDALQGQISQLVTDMEALQKAGLIYATEFWRRDGGGEPKYFYLLYPSKAGEQRKREYVGADEARIQEARAGIQRAKDYDALAETVAGLVRRVRGGEDALADAIRRLNGRLY